MLIADRDRRIADFALDIPGVRHTRVDQRQYRGFHLVAPHHINARICGYPQGAGGNGASLPPGNGRLTAYIVPQPEHTLSIEALRLALKQLPEYMLPSDTASKFSGSAAHRR